MKRYHPSNESAPPTPTTSANLTVSTTDAYSMVSKTLKMPPQQSNYTKNKNNQQVEIISPPNNLSSSSSSYPPNTTQQVVQISTDVSPLVTTVDVVDAAGVIELQQERNNQSSPIPTKNVVSGGRCKPSPPVFSSMPHNTTTPVIGLLGLTDTKEDCWMSAIDEPPTSTKSIPNRTGEFAEAVDKSSLSSNTNPQTSIFNNQITFSRAGENPTITSSSAHILKITSAAKNVGYNNTQIRNRANNDRTQLAKNVFNTISPPNKTVTDALETFSDTPPVPLEEPVVWGPSLHGGSSELDEVVDAVISNTTASLNFE